MIIEREIERGDNMKYLYYHLLIQVIILLFILPIANTKIRKKAQYFPLTKLDNRARISSFADSSFREPQNSCS